MLFKARGILIRSSRSLTFIPHIHESIYRLPSHVFRDCKPTFGICNTQFPLLIQALAMLSVNRNKRQLDLDMFWPCHNHFCMLLELILLFSSEFLSVSLPLCIISNFLSLNYLDLQHVTTFTCVF